MDVEGDIKAVYEDEEDANRVVKGWNERCEKNNAPQWMMLHPVEVNYFERSGN